MSETVMAVRNPKNPPEKIIDKTKEVNFVSPLQRFIMENCEQCTNYMGLCRPNDSRGLTPMSLCIQLYCHQTPDFLKNILQSGSIPPEAVEKIQEMEIDP